MNSENRYFKGPYAILPTPFLPDGKVDYEQVETLVDRLCRTELAGLVTCGSTSEFVMLSVEENKEIMRVASNAANGRKPLVCGATGPDSRTSMEYLSWMAGLGAAGALIAPPYYYRYSGGEVVEFYRDLDKNSCGVKIAAYQIPAFSSPIPLERMEELMSLPSVAALKNSSADIKQIMHQVQIRDEMRENFSILTGTDDALVPCLAGGCDGSFTALACIFPETVCQIYQAMKNRDLQTALYLQNELLPLTRLADRTPFPVGYKLLAEAAGMLQTSYRQSLGESMKEDAWQSLQQMREILAEKALR